MSAYIGDFPTSATIRKMWNSNAIAGESITRATNGTISVYKDSNTTQSTAGVTDTEDFDSLTGVHNVVIDTSADGTFYSAGSEFEVVLSGATIDGKTINTTLFSFSIERSGGILALLKGANGLAAIKTQTAAIEVDTQDIQSRIPAALVGGRIDANMGAISADATAADNLEAALDGTGGVTITAGLTGNVTGNLSGSVGSVTGNVGGNVAGSVGSVTGNIGGNLAGSVGSVTGAVGSVTGNVGGNVAGSVGSVTGNVGGNVVGSVGSVTAEVTPTAASKTGYRLSATGVGDILTTALTESYAADGAAPTLSQAIFAIQQMMQERAITTTTLTVKKLDGTTAAMTFTLDDANSPTSITRAT